jgi:hypothetical protein
MATVINVMIASPSDVAKERQIIRDEIYKWDTINSPDKKIVLLPVGWETHSSPKMGNRPQEIINQQVLENCDLLIAVFWTRLGSPTGSYISGTVEEINKHIEANKPAMIYFSNQPVHPDSVDNYQYSLLSKFREHCKKNGLIETYESLSEFSEKFTRQLSHTIIKEFSNTKDKNKTQISNVSLIKSSTPLSDEAKKILEAAADDPNGTILNIRTNVGPVIKSNSKVLFEPGDRRVDAKWEAGLKILVNNGYLEERGSKGEVFVITNDGYDMNDRLKKLKA